jgi:hypothetical protein
MATITKQYTFTNGTIADGTQVNKNFDDIYTLANGNIDTANIKDGSITAAKFASSINGIETVYYKTGSATLSHSGGSQVVISQSLVLPSAYNCLILADTAFNQAYTSATFNHSIAYLMDSSNQLDTAMTLSWGDNLHLMYFGSFNAGNHNITVNVSPYSDDSDAPYKAKLVIVQFIH